MNKEELKKRIRLAQQACSDLEGDMKIAAFQTCLQFILHQDVPKKIVKSKEQSKKARKPKTEPTGDDLTSSELGLIADKIPELKKVNSKTVGLLIAKAFEDRGERVFTNNQLEKAYKSLIRVCPEIPAIKDFTSLPNDIKKKLWFDDEGRSKFSISAVGVRELNSLQE